MRKLTLKLAFILTATELSFLNSLPANGPDAEISGKDVRTIGNIYYKFFGGTNLYDDLIKEAQKTKWPNGNRMKTHEAQRSLLDMLYSINVSASTGQIDAEFILQAISTHNMAYIKMLPAVVEVSQFDIFASPTMVTYSHPAQTPADEVKPTAPDGGTGTPPQSEQVETVLETPAPVTEPSA